MLHIKISNIFMCFLTVIYETYKNIKSTICINFQLNQIYSFKTNILLKS